MPLVSNADPPAYAGYDEPSTSGKDPLKVAAGLKGTLKSPRVSREAKERAKRRLDGIAGSTAQLISAQEATVVARDLHKEEAKGGKGTHFFLFFLYSSVYLFFLYLFFKQIPHSTSKPRSTTNMFRVRNAGQRRLGRV